METVEQRIERIQRPGNGYGDGCTVVARKEGETEGVAWTRITVTDNWSGERETIYMTETGWQVETCVGSYGSGIRWSFHNVEKSGTLQFAENLTRVFGAIAKSKAHTDQEESHT